jgi:serine/threonine protein kinase
MSDINIGLKLTNRYELLEPLGQGSMGRVYLAEDMLLGNVKVAIKFLSQTLLNDRMRERFMQEAMTCALLGQHSIHVVRVTDYGVSDDGVPFYVMEYLQGQSLSHLINLSPLPNSAVSRVDSAAVFRAPGRPRWHYPENPTPSSADHSPGYQTQQYYDRAGFYPGGVG